MSETSRYDVFEYPGGWRVIERNANGEKFHQTVFKSEAAARARVDKLHAMFEERTACASVRKRSANRCECLGECGRGHTARCPLRHGEHGQVPGGAAVVLSVVALNHDSADLRQANLRGYCQLCRCHYDDAADGADPLFTIGAPE